MEGANIRHPPNGSSPATGPFSNNRANRTPKLGVSAPCRCNITTTFTITPKIVGAYDAAFPGETGTGTQAPPI